MFNTEKADFIIAIEEFVFIRLCLHFSANYRTKHINLRRKKYRAEKSTVFSSKINNGFI